MKKSFVKTQDKPAVSVIIPAYNEEGNIKNTIISVLKAVKGTVADFEIIVINDGSTDRTKEILEAEQKRNKKIKLINNPRNLGFGISYKKGIKAAKKEYLTGFPGDNDMSWQSLKELITRAHKTDLVSTYMVNPEKRSSVRRLISALFVVLLNTIYRLKLKYYNGHFICKTKLLKGVRLYSEGVVLLAEIKIRLIKNGASFIEIPFEHTGRVHGSSKAFTLKNIGQTIYSIAKISRDVYL